MWDVSRWSKEWPKPLENTKYWFYGWRFRSEYTHSPSPPRLYLVEVRPVRDGKVAYICAGCFLYKGEGAVGFWHRAVTPETPTEEDVRKLLEEENE